jgi:hypothetical protein
MTERRTRREETIKARGRQIMKTREDKKTKR